MSEYENNESATAVEAPPAEKPEKPKRAVRKKKVEEPAAAASEEPAAEAPAAAAADEPEPVPVAAASSNGEGSADGAEAEAPAEVVPERQQKTQAAETLDIRMLKEMKLPDITKLAKDIGVENATGMRKQDLIFSILQAQTEKWGLIFSEGVLE